MLNLFISSWIHSFSSLQQMQRVSKGLDWIIESMVDKGSSKSAPNLPDIDSMRDEGN